jgi:hypothetical protein
MERPSLSLSLSPKINRRSQVHSPVKPIRSEKQPSRAGNGVIRATLLRSDTASALGINVRAYTPVLELCRALVAAGHDPATGLEAYRGDILCLKARSIGEAAGLEINSKGTGLIRRRPAVRTAPPIANSGRAYGGVRA